MGEDGRHSTRTICRCSRRNIQALPVDVLEEPHLLNKNLADKAIAASKANPDVDPKAFTKTLNPPGMLRFVGQWDADDTRSDRGSAERAEVPQLLQQHRES
jgi:hypothetical protein